MKKDIFIFDFDDTLLNTDELIYNCFKKVYKEFTNKDISLEELIKNYGPTEEGIFYALIKNDSYKEVFKRYLEEYKKEHSIIFKTLPKEFIDTFKFLKESNKKIIILTGRSKESLLISLDLLDLNKYIDGYYYGSLYGSNKKDSFNALLKDFNIDKDKIIYFGDSINDLKVCNELKIDIVSCLYFTNYNVEKIKENNPNYLLSYKDLLNCVKKYL